MEKETFIKRKIGDEELTYYFNIEFNQGSFMFYPYTRGYYLRGLPTKEVGGKFIADTQFEARELLFELQEPSDRALAVAQEVADVYVDSLILQIEQNKRDKEKEDESIRDEILKRLYQDNAKSMVTNDEKVKGDAKMKKDKEQNVDDRLEGIEECKYYVKPREVNFDDIAGMVEIKREVLEMVDMFKNPKKYTDMGVDLNLNNILLSGASGSGKTMIVRAMATCLDYPVFQMSGDASDKYVGQAKKNIKNLFDEARQYAPSIAFIDECEVIARKRGMSSENTEREAGTAELLQQLDGFSTTNDVICILATNLPESLDEAVLTRMSKKIHISNPDFETRKGILEIRAKKMKMSKDCDLPKIARILAGFSGRTIDTILNQAGILAVRKELEEITQVELEEAVDIAVAGLKSETKKINEKEREIVSNHESSHAILTYLLKKEKIQKISILPRTSSVLGYVSYANEDEDDVFLKTKKDILNSITVSLGGRAGEEIVFGKVTTGASNDLEHATYLAETMITKYGMCEETFGLMSINSNDIFMREKILNEVNEILMTCYRRAKDILIENRELLDEMAKTLIEKEEMNLEDFEKVLAKVGIVE